MATNSYFGFEFTRLMDPEEFFEELQDPLKHAATEGMRDVADTAKRRLRASVARNFDNHLTGLAKFENAYNVWAYPDRKKTSKDSLRPGVTVQGNPTWAEIFEEGGTVTPAKSSFLAIPMRDAQERGLASVGQGRGHARRISMTKEARARFGGTEVVKTDKGLFVTAKEAGKTLWLFQLVRSVHERKRTRLVDIAEQAMDLLPAKFAKHL